MFEIVSIFVGLCKYRTMHQILNDFAWNLRKKERKEILKVFIAFYVHQMLIVLSSKICREKQNMFLLVLLRLKDAFISTDGQEVAIF